MAGYIGTTPVPQATQHRESFTATGGQTSFATVGYTPQFIDVYLNGVKLAPADYTATNGSDVVLASGATASDILEIVAYTPFEVANQTFTGTTTAANLTVTGAFTSQGIDDNADAVAITIDSSENVGIGTSSPSNYHTGTNLTLFGSGDSGVTIASGTSNASRIHFADGTSGDAQYRGYVVYAHASDSLQIATSGSERMRIDSSGNVGIGTSSVGSETLVVEKSSGTPTIRINAPSGSQAQLKLQADGTVTDTQMIHANTDASLGFSRWDGSAYQERMRIDASGNLLVGKTSANATDVGIVANANGRLYAAASGASSIFNRTSSDGDIVDFRKDGSTVGSIGIQSTGFYIDGESGHAGIRFAGNEVSPRDNGSDADGVVSLGESDKRFKDLCLSGGVKWTEGQVEVNSSRLLMRSTGDASGLRFDGSGYTPFKNGSVADGTVDLGYSAGRYNNLYLAGGVYLGGVVGANKLDDYEEGTWTPAVSNMTVTGTLTTAGRYTKVGRMVSLMGWVSATTSIAHSVSALISGFPFAGAFVTGEGQSRSAGVIVAGANADLPSSNHSAACFVDSPNSRAFLGNFTTTAANEYIYINVVYYTA